MLLRLNENSLPIFDAAAEDAMGIQFGRAGKDLFLVLGGWVAVRWPLVQGPNDGLGVGAAPPWLNGALTQRPEPGFQGWVEVFQNWLNGLPFAPDLTPVSFRAVAGLVVVPPPVLAPAPAYPVGVYGHVPFQGTTQANDRLCRFEAWPTSRRVNTPVGQVAPGTFAGPWSEDQFIKCGFGAVARFALPSLLPACFRWEFEVSPGTPVKCGAAIPLYGQSGGGVEVELVGPTPGSPFIDCVYANQTTIPAI